MTKQILTYDCPRLRNIIWTLGSLEPRFVPLNYSKSRIDNVFKKSKPDIPWQTPQPLVLQVCKNLAMLGRDAIT